MSETKKVFKTFTIADYNEEEQWLREQANKGYHLQSVYPCVYIFEVGEPKDVIYRLEFKEKKPDADYLQLLADYGWEQCGTINDFYYFRKEASQTTNPDEEQLFSDAESKYHMIEKIWKRKFLPVIAILLLIEVMDVFSLFSGIDIIILLVDLFWGIYLIRIGVKLYKLKKALKDQM